MKIERMNRAAHSPLAEAYAGILKASPISKTVRLPFDRRVATRAYHSKVDCVRARDRVIEKAYRTAQEYFDINSIHCLARSAAEYYYENRITALQPTLAKLERLSALTEHENAFAEYKGMVEQGEKMLRSSFELEITESDNFYAMFNVDYYRDEAIVDTNDYRVSENGLFQMLEGIFADDVQYSVLDLVDAISEMDRDVNDLAAHYFKYVHRIYEEFIYEYVELLDVIGEGLPSFESEEKIDTYLDRMCELLPEKKKQVA